MSRIGKQEIILPSNVEVEISKDNLVKIKGKNGELAQKFNNHFKIEKNNGKLKVNRESDSKEIKALHGTTTALIKNMIIGVSEGFKKELELNGVGYRVNVSGKKVTLFLGYSHPIEVLLEDGVTAQAPSNTELIISGIDKQLVGEVAANIRKLRKPEPYKGKGVKYKNEVILRKEGKRAGK